MLKVVGHIYSDNTDNFEALIELLQENGYQIAYDMGLSATIIKEVPDEQR